MCKAWREILKDERVAGMEEERLRSIQNIMEGLQISLEQAMTVLKLSPKERKYCEKALKSLVM